MLVQFLLVAFNNFGVSNDIVTLEVVVLFLLQAVLSTYRILFITYY
jgi:hypothetical protein